MKKFNLKEYIGNNPLLKEDGQWDDKWSPSFDDLKNRAKQIKGFEDMGKYGFAIPYEHGEIEIEPQSNSEDVKITWISPGNEDSQVSPLSIGYKAVDQAIRSSQDKADWKRMAGLEEIKGVLNEGINPLKHHFLNLQLDLRQELINKLKDMDTQAYIATIEKLKDEEGWDGKLNPESGRGVYDYIMGMYMDKVESALESEALIRGYGVHIR